MAQLGTDTLEIKTTQNLWEKTSCVQVNQVLQKLYDMKMLNVILIELFIFPMITAVMENIQTAFFRYEV